MDKKIEKILAIIYVLIIMKNRNENLEPTIENLKKTSYTCQNIKDDEWEELMQTIYDGGIVSKLTRDGSIMYPLITD